MKSKAPSKKPPSLAVDPANGGGRASQNCDILPWKFRVYVGATGSAEVQKAIGRFDDAALEAFKSAVRHLAASPRDEWRRPEAAKLTGGDDLFEIRFKANNTQWRPVGFFGPSPGVFTITAICNKKQDVYAPPDAFKTAARRKRQVESDEAGTAPLTIDGEDFPPLPE